MRLVTEWFGTFLLAQERVVDSAFFPKDAAQIAARLDAMAAGESLEEERDLAAKAPEGGFEVVEDRLRLLPGARVVPLAPSPVANRAESFGFPRELLHEASLLHARSAMRRALARPDIHVVQAVDALDDLAEAANLLSERLREWYAMHDPEGANAIARHEELAALISQHGNREGVRAAKGVEGESMGGPLPPEEAAAVRGFARVTSSVYATRADIEKYLDERLPQIAPNLTVLVGAPIAARLLKLSGGLQRLARLPSGTIQTLGAEKALFRHLKEGAKPPKHGVLLQHPVLHRAPRAHRGPLARALAARVALAARADAFTGHRIADGYVAELEALAADLARRKPRGPRRGPPGGAPARREGRR